jgi:hypothetical protein
VRLTLIIPSMNPGGAERAMSTLANHWAAAGHSLVLITYDDYGHSPYYKLHPGIVHRALKLGSAGRSKAAAAWIFLKRLRILRREIRASRPEAVISFLDTTNVLALAATMG